MIWSWDRSYSAKLDLGKFCRSGTCQVRDPYFLRVVTLVPSIFAEPLFCPILEIVENMHCRPQPEWIKFRLELSILLLVTVAETQRRGPEVPRDLLQE